MVAASLLLQGELEDSLSCFIDNRCLGMSGYVFFNNSSSNCSTVTLMLSPAFTTFSSVSEGGTVD